MPKTFHCWRNCSSALFTSRQLIVLAKYFRAFATFEVPTRRLVLFDVAYCALQVTFLLDWLGIARKQYECRKFILFQRLCKKSLWTPFWHQLRRICVCNMCWKLSICTFIDFETCICVLKCICICACVYLCIWAHMGLRVVRLGQPSSSWQLAELATAVAAQGGGKLHM